jgi:glutathione peroxidase
LFDFVKIRQSNSMPHGSHWYRIGRQETRNFGQNLTNTPGSPTVSPMKIFAWLLAAFALQLATAQAESFYDIKIKDIDGHDTSLAPYKGKVLLIVNVASKCGYTPQYKALEALYETNKDQGFVVLGFPCNQFKSQEPGSDDEIKKFCTETYDVTFPLFDKLEVNGPSRHPLYAALTGQDPVYPIHWNFTKFLIGRDGRIIQRFDSNVKPDSKEVTDAIKKALAEK